MTEKEPNKYESVRSPVSTYEVSLETAERKRAASSTHCSSKVNANYPSLIMTSRDYPSLCYFFFLLMQTGEKKRPSPDTDSKPFHKCWERASGYQASSSAKEPRKREKTPVCFRLLTLGHLPQIVICLELFQGSQVISTSIVLLT